MLVCRECQTSVVASDGHYTHQYASNDCTLNKNILFATGVTDPSWLSARWYSACCGAIVHEGECTACMTRAMEVAYCPVCSTEMAYVPKSSHLYCPSCKLEGNETSYNLEGSPFLQDK